MASSSQVQTQFFTSGSSSKPFRLTGGGKLKELTIAYETYGALNERKDNAILLFHAMTGSQHAAGWNPQVDAAGDFWTEECRRGWWDKFIGPGAALDTDEFCVICANYLGGCYGSTGPASPAPNGKRYGAKFPEISLRDIVESQVALLDHLGIHQLHAAVGGSIGGMLCLILATQHPERVRNVIPIAAGMHVTPLQRIHNFEQIFAITSDPDFKDGNYEPDKPPLNGLCQARMIAHKTFVSLSTLERRARREIAHPRDVVDGYRLSTPLESYMLHQGQKFAHRFDANSYLRILEAWQRFDLLEGSGARNVSELFQRCREQQFLVFSIDSDVSFYPDEQNQLVRALKRADVPVMRITVHSEKGHDSFLIEPELYMPHLWFMLKEQR